MNLMGNPESKFADLLFGVGTDGWMMSIEERLMLQGILATSACHAILELGYGEGGCTRWLSTVCESVVTVDMEPIVQKASALPNVTPMQMTTGAAISELVSAGRKFDVAIVDAGHDTDNVREDVLGSARLADVIVLHDIYYPPSRRGALEAVATLKCWSNLDLVAGYFKDGALWGGIGIVCPNIAPHDAPLKSSALGGEYLSKLFELRKQRRLSQVPKWTVRFAELSAKVLRDARERL